MTILQAIKSVMTNAGKPMTSTQIYESIIREGLYSFGAKDPKGVVNRLLRTHCIGIEFASASPVKHFRAHGRLDNATTFVLRDYEGEHSVQCDVSLAPEAIPEEKIHTAYTDHMRAMSAKLLDTIMNANPAFFERLVVDLLIKMGYGGYDPASGLVVGGPNDGGIDGIIREDKLGLDKIYIQAKRYSPDKTVCRPHLQRFVGAMEAVTKGIFITTSSFSSMAKAYADKQQKSLVLVDGEQLTHLMIKYEVGTTVIRTYATYRIDNDYFTDTV